ncbi:hypothetical protein QBC45DRAFT_319164, partial [Copromyces sp. CBS 386.78]
RGYVKFIRLRREFDTSRKYIKDKKAFNTNYSILLELPPIYYIIPTLNFIRSRPGNATYSEFKGINANFYILLLNLIFKLIITV